MEDGGRWIPGAVLPALVLALALVPVPVTAQRTLRVVTTTTDLASLVRTIGGERVEVVSMALGTQDPHYVEPKPSLILELRRADLYLQVGLDLEVGWAPLLLDQSRNPRLQPGGAGHLDLSGHVEVLDIPVGRVTRAEGDIHPYGNPHYWLHPENGLRMAEAIASRLSSLDPDGSPAYDRALVSFRSDVEAAIARWRRVAEPIRGAPLVAYHNSWKYLADFLELEIVDYVEPRPGIPPAPRHLTELVGRMTRGGVRVIVMDPFHDPRVSRSVADRAGARLLVLPSSVGGVPEVQDYVALLDHNIAALVDALSP
jgi:zinc/manganese transport system substrate-binding protein